MNDHFLAGLVHFENEDRLFAGVTNKMRFAIVVLGNTEAADLFFYARQATDLRDSSRHFRLTPSDFELLNPNTRTCPTFRSVVDAELNKYIYRRTGVLWDENRPDGNPWGLSFLRMFDMANDSGLFRTRAEMEAAEQTLKGNTWDGPLGTFLPLLEAKMVHHYDHRFGTYENATEAHYNKGFLPLMTLDQHSDQWSLPLPDCWVSLADVRFRLGSRAHIPWLFAWRDVTGATLVRSLIAAVTPTVAIGHKLPLLFSTTPCPERISLLACLSSFVLDYCARQKVGGTSVSYFLLKQFPIGPPLLFHRDVLWASGESLLDWLLPRVVELVYTAWDLEGLGIDCGYPGPPFLWDEERRFILRAELDALFFHLYLGTLDDWTHDASASLRAQLPSSRDAVAHIMDSFSIVQRKETETFGKYRTKEVILEVYDAMATAIRTRHPYVSRLSPHPADPSRRCQHG